MNPTNPFELYKAIGAAVAISLAATLAIMVEMLPISHLPALGNEFSYGQLFWAAMAPIGAAVLLQLARVFAWPEFSRSPAETRRPRLAAAYFAAGLGLLGLNTYVWLLRWSQSDYAHRCLVRVYGPNYAKFVGGGRHWDVIGSSCAVPFFTEAMAGALLLIVIVVAVRPLARRRHSRSPLESVS